ncbi:MAG: FAD-dependent oxidoreductase [Deltaproteobacteria bacterium]|nr:FAD-dependent oxidoreductase [Deltaproteobacteria bacterium]
MENHSTRQGDNINFKNFYTTDILVIGGVAAGPKAAARARRLAPEREITIVDKCDEVSYAGCGLPFLVSGDVSRRLDLMTTYSGEIRDPAYFEKVKGIRVLTRVEARSINRKPKEVQLVDIQSGRSFSMRYRQLVLATGSRPVFPDLEGVKLENIYCLHRPGDAAAIREAIASGEIKRAVVVGAGPVGLEAVDALVRNGIKTTVVEILPAPAPKLLDPELGGLLRKHLEEQGVALEMEDRVMRFEGNGQGRVHRVITGKKTLEADLVVMGLGVRPEVDIAVRAGLALGPTGAIRVNDRLQTSDPDIYAGGDCVEVNHLLTGKPVYAPLGSTANKHGRVIGDNITGRDSRFPGVLGTYIVRTLETTIARTGLTEQEAMEAGHSVVTALVAALDRPHYMPGNRPLVMKLVASREGRLLGIQIVGRGEVAKRMDVAAAAISTGATLERVSNMDLAYAPPFATDMDALIQGVNVLRNKIDETASTVAAPEIRSWLDEGKDFTILDVRTEQEYDTLWLDFDNLVNIPLDQLRNRLNELPRDREIVTLCALGPRSYEGARLLQHHGFGRVKFLEGGMVAWPYELW